MIITPVIKEEELCQVSLTGMRALVVVGMLMQEPQSLNDIRQALLSYKLIDEDTSTDILRIDLNTLRAMGCEITRATQSTNFKYKLIKHPFALNIKQEEINVIKRAYNKIKDEADIKTLIGYDTLFKKIAKLISDEENKQAILGISILKNISLDKVTELINYCAEKKQIKISYKSPASQKESVKDIITEKIIFKNDKIYLQGYEFGTGLAVSLNVKRITDIITSTESSDDIVKDKKIKVKFLLKNFNKSGLMEEESFIEETGFNGYVIEGLYHNNFIATQRILSFGPACTILEPESFKNEIIELLKKMRSIYHE